MLALLSITYIGLMLRAKKKKLGELMKNRAGKTRRKELNLAFGKQKTKRQLKRRRGCRWVGEGLYFTRKNEIRTEKM